VCVCGRARACVRISSPSGCFSDYTLTDNFISICRYKEHISLCTLDIYVVILRGMCILFCFENSTSYELGSVISLLYKVTWFETKVEFYHWRCQSDDVIPAVFHASNKNASLPRKHLHFGNYTSYKHQACTSMLPKFITLNNTIWLLL